MNDAAVALPTRREMLLLTTMAGFLAIVGELPEPYPEQWKLPECEALPNPFSADFDPAFGAGIGMVCSVTDQPASPRVVITDHSVLLEGPDRAGRLHSEGE